MVLKKDESKIERILSQIKTRRIDREIVNVDEEKVKLVIFLLNEDHFAFYGSNVKEILALTEITYVPGAPDFFHGIINVRGDIDSVINIHKYLELENSENKSRSRIVITASGNIRSGILVDSVEDVVDVPVSSIKPPISTLDKSLKYFVIGETTYKNRNVTILDVGKILRKEAS